MPRIIANGSVYRKLTVSQMFMLQQFSIVISHWSGWGLLVNGVMLLLTMIRFLILGLFLRWQICLMSITTATMRVKQISISIVVIESFRSLHIHELLPSITGATAMVTFDRSSTPVFWHLFLAFLYTKLLLLSRFNWL